LPHPLAYPIYLPIILASRAHQLAAMAKADTGSVDDRVASMEMCLHADNNPNMVNWEGPDDPKNPRNWTQRFKLLNVLLIGLSILCTYGPSSVVAHACYSN
jgi:hypothetical protein